MTERFVLPQVLRYSLAGVYGYGAAVHVANMLGWTGFDWGLAPTKWQVLDVVYLALDLAVVVGLLAALRWAVFALLLAATTQIFLYTVFRVWVLDVPTDFAVASSDLAYLNALIAFHVATLLMIGAVSLRNQRSARLR